ncbi:MAG: TlpA disulfide reductase family protein [bacterium]
MEGNVFSRCLSLILILLVALVFTSEGEEGDLFSKIRIDPIKGDKKAPDFSLRDLNGNKVEMKQLKGKIILLNFWATWCGPCKEEMPSLEVLHQRFKERDFVLLSISVDYERLERVQEFINKHHYTFPVLLDPQGETLDLFEVKGVPTTFLIDKTGRMVGKATGPRDWKSPEVFCLINLLTEK